MTIDLKLCPSTDGEDTQSTTFQDAAKAFEAQAAEGSQVSAYVHFQKSDFGQSLLTGDFVLASIRTVEPIITALIGYYAGRQKRTVRVKANGVEIEAGSVEEVERLLRSIANSPSDD